MASSGKIKSYTFEHGAYALPLYHSLKYSANPVCGFLMGRIEGNNAVVFERAVPFSHTHALSPTLKMACHCAETLCAGGEKSLEILGLYVANDIIQKTESLHPLHRNIYERLVQNNPASSVWIIDASRLEQEEIFAYRGYTAPQRAGDLQPINESAMKTKGPVCLMESTRKMEYLAVQDFDDHLHDPEKDWTNKELVEKLAMVSA
ncbi:unnamed protein product [Amoebophrya sp. A120]|nr:unnamed protein product [Amoebophrya sp. A120]|eukprot:GSA120T00009484001.1